MYLRLARWFIDDSVSVVKEGVVTQVTVVLNELYLTKNLTYTDELPIKTNRNLDKIST